MIVWEEISINTNGELDIVDITEKCKEKIKDKVKEGIAILFLDTGTASLTFLENEEGLKKDFQRMLETIVPSSKHYEHRHDNLDHIINSQSHIRSSILGTCLAIPIKDSNAVLGKRQQIIFVELDNRTRKRTVKILIMGE